MSAFRAALPLVFALAGLLPLALLGPAVSNREKPGSKGFILVVVGISLWSFGAAGLVLAETAGAALAAFSLRIAGPLVSASGFFLLLAEYAGVLYPSRRVLGAIGAFAVAVQLLTWTNPFHHLVYRPSVSLTAGPVEFEQMGVVWVANTVVAYGFNAAAFLLGAFEAQRASGLRRRQTVTVLAAAIPPIALNVLAQFWVSVAYDPTALGFVVTAFVMGWALYGGTFLDIVPVGRRRAVETMSDPVVVIDREGRIVDSNPAARELVGAGDDWKGMPADQFFAPFSDHVERFRDTETVATEISIHTESGRRHFDLNISPIRGPQGETQGRLVDLRDVTKRKERERELDLMRQVQSRVLRHNIRNELQVVRGTNELFAEELTGERSAMASEVVDRCDALIQTSTKARSIEQLLDGDREPVAVDLADTVSSVVDELAARFPSVSFRVDCPDECVVETAPAMEFAIENLVENAAEHNNSDDPRVDVSVATDEEGVTVAVSDNGPAIPDQELAVLERGNETSLSHGSGMGLWVVDWAVDRAAASVAFDTGPDGTDVTVRLPRQPADAGGASD